MRDSTLVGIVVSGGLLGALVFAVGWLSRRGEPGQPRASWGPFEHLRGYGKWPRSSRNRQGGHLARTIEHLSVREGSTAWQEAVIGTVREITCITPLSVHRLSAWSRPFTLCG